MTTDYIKTPLTEDEFRKKVKDGRLTVTFAIDLNTLIELQGIDGMNDWVDDHVFSSLSDLGYSLVGATDGNNVLIELDADASDVLEEIGTSSLTDEQRQAAYDALGNDEVEDSQIDNALAQFKDWETKGLKTSLRNLERQFEAAGGRGVELADEIDNMRIVLAVRRVKVPRT